MRKLYNESDWIKSQELAKLPSEMGTLHDQKVEELIRFRHAARMMEGLVALGYIAHLYVVTFVPTVISPFLYLLQCCMWKPELIDEDEVIDESETVSLLGPPVAARADDSEEAV